MFIVVHFYVHFTNVVTKLNKFFSIHRFFNYPFSFSSATAVETETSTFSSAY